MYFTYILFHLCVCRYACLRVFPWQTNLWNVIQIPCNFLKFYGAVETMKEWATGRSGPQGVVGHGEEWATGRSEPQGGVGHRQEWATWRGGPQGVVCLLM